MILEPGRLSIALKLPGPSLELHSDNDLALIGFRPRPEHYLNMLIEKAKLNKDVRL
jgi:hypothetical protein